MSTVNNRVVTTRDWQSGSVSPWEIAAGLAVLYVLMRGGLNLQAGVSADPNTGSIDGTLEYGAPGIPGIPPIPGY